MRYKVKILRFLNLNDSCAFLKFQNGFNVMRGDCLVQSCDICLVSIARLSVKMSKNGISTTQVATRNDNLIWAIRWFAFGL